MSNTGIVKREPFSTHENRKEKVFKCLYDQYEKGGGGLSQSEMKERLGLSQSTIYRALTELQNNPYTRGTYKYTTVFENGLYYIIKEYDKSRMDELYQNAIATLADKKAFTNKAAIVINKNLISFEVKKSYCAVTIKTLKSFFRSTYIFDMAIHNKGIYILLKDGKSAEQKEDLKKRLCGFYALVVERIEKNKKLDKMSSVKAKEVLKK